MRIFGGLGSDTVEVGGQVPPLCSTVSGGRCVNTGLEKPTLPASDPRTALIQGPIVVFGGLDPDPEVSRDFPPPVLLPGESATEPVLPDNPVFEEIESAQIDTLRVFNTASAANDVGTVTGRPSLRVRDGRSPTFTGKPTDPRWHRVRRLRGARARPRLRQRPRHLESTHAGTTGSRATTAPTRSSSRTIAGHTFIQGGAGNDQSSSANASLLDDIRAMLVLDGGTGVDYVLADDSAEADNSLGTLTQTTLTGLDMTATSALDRLYSVTAGGAAFSITLAGFGNGWRSRAARALPLSRPRCRTCSSRATRAGRPTAASARRASSSGRPAATTSSGSRASSSPASQPALTVHRDGRAARRPRPTTPAASTTTASRASTIKLGSGHDRFNVRGTLPVTDIHAAGGDDSSTSPTPPTSAPARRRPLRPNGDLAVLHDAILHGDAAARRPDLRRLARPRRRRASTRTRLGQQHALRQRPQRPGRRRRRDDHRRLDHRPRARRAITYDALAGDLGGQGYWTRTADAGLFGRGINVYGGRGGNTYTVTSVLASALTPAPFGVDGHVALPRRGQRQRRPSRWPPTNATSS